MSTKTKPVGLSVLHTRVGNPAIDEALSSASLGGWYPKNVVVLSEAKCSVLRDFPAGGARWKKCERGVWIAKLPYARALVEPIIGLGWFVKLETEHLQGGRPGDFQHVLTEANSAEALVVVPELKLAKRLAFHAVRRAKVGDIPAPLPGIRWRPLPYDIYTYVFDERNAALKYAPALDSPEFDFAPPHQRPAQAPVAATPATDFRVTINLGDTQVEYSGAIGAVNARALE